ncbi:MAG: molybdopterin molybdotransferase MoeA, partial [Actinomycetota bacterium]|nr:molybdopterin molybdotransferase MoeA [Actinomycetota bacterium]
MLTPVEEVRAAILATCAPLPAVEVPLSAAAGLVAAGSLPAPFDVPPFANTAMDGYAVRAADTANPPARLAVVGVLPAGGTPDTPVGTGQAVRIMTGAPIPPGADAVVMVERTQPLDGGASVLIEIEATPGMSIREAGSDVRAGTEVVPAGTPLSAGHIGVLASLGYEQVPVHSRPRVGVLATGDELVDGSEPLRPGKIHDSNRPMLLTMASQSGAEPVDLGRDPDDPEAIAASIERAVHYRRCDAVLVTGGVSVGDFDYVSAVLGRLGQLWTWDVAMKPGKPLAFGMVDGRPVFGLPGNPVSAAVSFEMFARPALRTLMGHPEPFRPLLAGTAAEPFRRRPDGKLHVNRVVARWVGQG